MMDYNGILSRMDNENRFQYLSPSELKQRLEQKAILYFPTGSLEWHNEHLPLGTDTFVAVMMAQRLCEKTGGAILPPFWWNTGSCHRSSSTYYMPECHYRGVLKTVCMGFKDFPAKMLVIVNGHGGDYQYESMDYLARELNSEKDFPMKTFVADPFKLVDSLPFQMDHADKGETSISMELFPNLVRLDSQLVPDLYSGKMPFSNGMPSRELGHDFWDAAGDTMAGFLLKEYEKFK